MATLSDILTALKDGIELSSSLTLSSVFVDVDDPASGLMTQTFSLLSSSENAEVGRGSGKISRRDSITINLVHLFGGGTYFTAQTSAAADEEAVVQFVLGSLSVTGVRFSYGSSKRIVDSVNSYLISQVVVIAQHDWTF